MLETRCLFDWPNEERRWFTEASHSSKNDAGEFLSFKRDSLPMGTIIKNRESVLGVRSGVWSDCNPQTFTEAEIQELYRKMDLAWPEQQGLCSPA